MYVGRTFSWRTAVVVVLLATVGLAVGAAGPASAQSDANAQPGGVSGCTTIDSPGTYELTTDVSASTTDTCIRVTAGDVVFEGNDHRINNTDFEKGTGINVTGQSSTTVTNVTIRNVTVTSWDRGIALGKFRSGEQFVDGATIADVNVSSNDDGVRVRYPARNATIRDTVMTENDDPLIVEANGAVLRNVTAVNNSGTAIEFDDSSDSDDPPGLEATLRDVNASGNDGEGIQLSGDDTGLPGSTLTNITAINNRLDGIEIDSSDVTLRNALLVNNNRGVGVDGHNVTHVNVTAYGNVGDDVKTDENGTARGVVVENESDTRLLTYFERENRVILNEPPGPPDYEKRGIVDVARYVSVRDRGRVDAKQLNFKTFIGPEQDAGDVTQLHKLECDNECSWTPVSTLDGGVETDPTLLAPSLGPDDAPTVEYAGQSWNYRVWYNVTEPDATTYALFTIERPAPDGSIALSPSPPTAGESVTFNGSSFNDSDTNVTGYNWTFVGESGIVGSGTGATTTQTFDSAGSYTAILSLATENLSRVRVEKTFEVESSTTSTPTPVTTKEEGPGFGPVAALAALVVLAVLAVRRRPD